MSITVNPGRLNQRVKIQARSVVRDAAGQETITWTDTFTNVPAEVMPLRGREFFAAAQVHQQQSIKALMRYKAGVDAADRLVWDGLNYDITAVIRLGGQKRWMEVMADTGVKDGR